MKTIVRMSIDKGNMVFVLINILDVEMRFSCINTIPAWKINSGEYVMCIL